MATHYSPCRAALTAAIAVIVLSGVPARAGSQYVIVAADPPAEQFKPGKVLEVDDTIVVPAGSVVTLLGEDGSVNAIPGPASITVTEDSVETVGESDRASRDRKRSTISKLAELLSGEKKNADSLGVARGFGERPKPRGLDDPWAVSVESDGVGCVRNGEVRLGRASDGETLSVAISGVDSGNEQVLTWRTGEANLEVPGSVSTGQGEIFVKAGKNRARISIRTLPGSVNMQNPVDVLGWMLDSGCEGQALALTRQLVIEAQ